MPILEIQNISKQFDQGFITNDERYRLTVENWMKTDATVQSTLADQFVKEDSSMSIAVNSGARGNIGQVKTAVGLLGVVTDATGRAIELPIRNNYKHGLTPLEYFTATRGARKGMIDTALKTADSGYLTRRLVDVSQDVFTTDEEFNTVGSIETAIAIAVILFLRDIDTLLRIETSLSENSFAFTSQSE